MDGCRVYYWIINPSLSPTITNEVNPGENTIPLKIAANQEKEIASNVTVAS
jgi:hypothetical protein